MRILWHIKEYMISATISGDVNLDDLLRLCLSGFSTLKLLFSLFCTLLEGSLAYTQGEGNRDTSPGEKSITVYRHMLKPPC